MCSRSGLLQAGVMLLAAGDLSRAGAAEGHYRLERRLATMGTELVITVEAAGRAEALAASEAVVRQVEAVEARLSTWRAETALTALNRAPVGAWVPVDPELERELGRALDGARATRGGFDPCVGALVAAWDLRGTGRIPSESEIHSALGGVGGLELRPGAARRAQDRAIVEEGGFGKGAAVDAALAALASTDAAWARLDFGGQIAWFERGPSTPRMLDVAHPRERARIVCTLSTLHTSVSTSGNGERTRLVAGRRVGHLLDPRDGSMAPDRGSVTVLASSALFADALSTGFYVLGPEAALRAADEIPDVDVVFVEELAGGRVRIHATDRAARGISRLDPDAELVRAPLIRSSTPSSLR